MAILFNQKRIFSEIWFTTGGGVSFSANYRDSSSFDYFSDTAQVDDAIYFGAGEAGRFKWKDLTLYVGTALAGTGITLAWEYYDHNHNWSPLTVTD